MVRFWASRIGPSLHYNEVVLGKPFYRQSHLSRR